MKVIVIGGGVMGLACAMRLAEGGTAVEVIEARTCGAGATLAALGALWPPSPLAYGPLQQLHRASLWQFETFIKDVVGRTGMPISFRRAGRIELLSSIKAVARAREEAAAAQQSCGLVPTVKTVMEVVDPATIAREFPMLAPIHFATLRCHVTAQVNVSQLVVALKQACLSMGVVIRENMNVASLAELRAGAILVTAGAWTSRLSPELNASTPVTPARGQGIALAVRPAFNCVIKSGKTYLVPWENEILVGSTTEPEVGYDESTTPDARKQLQEGATAIIPALAAAPVSRHWAGLRPDAPKHMPIMGPIRQSPGLFVCTGHYKTGIGLSPLVSTLMARAILTNEIPPELLPFLPRPV